MSQTATSAPLPSDNSRKDTTRASIQIASWNDVLMLVREPNRHGKPVLFIRIMFGKMEPRRFGPFPNLKQAQAWPSVTGTIVKSGVESYSELVGKTHSTLYRPALEYSYLVHGREYRGNQIKLGLAVSGNESYAQKVAGKYREGDSVEVHYDPANPGSAALENPTGATWVSLGIAVVCFAFAAYLLGIFK